MPRSRGVVEVLGDRSGEGVDVLFVARARVLTGLMENGHIEVSGEELDFAVGAAASRETGLPGTVVGLTLRAFVGKRDLAPTR